MSVVAQNVHGISHEMLETFTPGTETGAVFSPCRTWRYVLWRNWEPANEKLIVIGLNPSTATETEDDPTIRRCIGFAKRDGFGGLLMLNAFGFRARHPSDMFAADDSNGPDNDKWIAYCTDGRKGVVAAWGVHCPPGRELEIIRIVGRSMLCFGHTKDGRPNHPLFLRKDTPYRRFP